MRKRRQRETLLGAVRKRLQLYGQTRDPHVILAREVVDEIEGIRSLVRDFDADLEAAHVLGWLHWHRAMALGPEHHAYDLRTALELFLPVFLSRSESVPELVRDTYQDQRQAAPEPGDGSPGQWNDAAIQLVNEYERTHALAALEESIRLFLKAVEATSDAAAEKPPMLCNLSLALLKRYDRRRDPKDIQQGVATLERAVHLTPDGDEWLANRLLSLGLALRMLGEQSDADLTLLDRSVETLRRAAAVASPSDPDKANYLANLSLALDTRFERTGNIADSDEAITAARSALELTYEDHPDRARNLTRLASALEQRFDRTGELSALEEAVETDRMALRGTSTENPKRAWALINLGGALYVRYEVTGQSADHDEAITLLTEAVALIPEDSPVPKATALANLSHSLRERYRASGDAADLDQAIIHARHAVRLTPPGHTSMSRHLSQYGNALKARFERTGHASDLDGAIESLREAVRLAPPDHPKSAWWLNNLGLALAQRAHGPDGTAAYNEALNTLKAAASVAVADPTSRVGAGVEGGRLAARAGHWEEATRMLADAIELLPQVAPREIERRSQEYGLGKLAGLAADAAACALNAGQPERAVELLEQGRGVLITQTLETREDIAALREHHPELGDRFAALRNRLDASSGTRLASADQDNQGQRRTIREWDELLRRIRDRPGFERFLRAPRIAELIDQASEGPIVLVNVSPYRSDALILTSQGVTAVPLPEADHSEIRRRVVTFVGAVQDANDPAASIAVRKAATKVMLDAIGWLQESVTGPVLEALGIPARPAVNGRLPRVWWSPVGLLSFLPLHAAVFDVAVSSYTPTIQALRHARSLRRADSERRILLVAMPQTPGLSSLPGVTREIELIRHRMPHADLVGGEDATRAQILDLLSTHHVVHFACHAATDPASPSRARLYLHDHLTNPLTAQDIAAKDMGRAELAFLAACETARNQPGLADESVHIASAFQLAGYRHVVGTLWTVADDIAPHITDDFYAHLQPPGERFDPDQSAFALHAAVRAVRSRYPNSPVVWAAHIHTGA